MKKYFFILLFVATSSFYSFADVITDDFSANAFGWTECAFESSSGSSVIDQGCLTIKSKGENKGMGAFLTAMSGVKTKVGENTQFETHCYAPLNVQHDFKIVSNVKIDKLDKDRLVGFLFNYKDDGNFYCFAFNNEMISFQRWVDGNMVGGIKQSMKWEDRSKVEQQWTLQKEGDELVFFVDNIEVIRVRYMTIDYAGVGFWTFGKQTLVVYEMQYQQ